MCEAALTCVRDKALPRRGLFWGGWETKGQSGGDNAWKEIKPGGSIVCEGECVRRGRLV